MHSQAVLLYCCLYCPSYPTHLNSIGWTTWAIWTAIKKYRVNVFCVQLEDNVKSKDGFVDMAYLLDQVGHHLDDFKAYDNQKEWVCFWIGTNKQFVCPDSWFKKVSRLNKIYCCSTLYAYRPSRRHILSITITNCFICVHLYIIVS